MQNFCTSWSWDVVSTILLHLCQYNYDGLIFAVRIPIPEQCEQRTGNSEYGDNYKQWGNYFDSRSFSPELAQSDNVWKQRVKEILSDHEIFRNKCMQKRNWPLMIGTSIECSILSAKDPGLGYRHTVTAHHQLKGCKTLFLIRLFKPFFKTIR